MNNQSIFLTFLKRFIAIIIMIFYVIFIKIPMNIFKKLTTKNKVTKHKSPSILLKIFKRVSVAILLISYVILIKMPLSILSILIAVLIELLDVLLGFIVRKKLSIDYECPKISYTWQDTEKFLKSAIIEYLSD
jgi:hypothetical protein